MQYLCRFREKQMRKKRNRGRFSSIRKRGGFRGRVGRGGFLKVAQKCNISVDFRRKSWVKNEIVVSFPQFEKGADLGGGWGGVVF